MDDDLKTASDVILERLESAPDLERAPVSSAGPRVVAREVHETERPPAAELEPAPAVTREEAAAPPRATPQAERPHASAPHAPQPEGDAGEAPTLRMVESELHGETAWREPGSTPQQMTSGGQGEPQTAGMDVPARTSDTFEVELPEAALPERDLSGQEPGPLGTRLEKDGASSDEDGVTRIQIDRDLALEVTTDAQGVKVLLEGTVDAVEPLRDLGPELESALAHSGFSLDGFEAREKKQGARGESSGPQQAEREERRVGGANRPIKRGTLVDRVA
jgi:hypothetical protein